MNENGLNVDEVKEESSSYESFSSYVIQQEDCQHYINNEVDGNHTLDAFDIISNVSNNHGYYEFTS